MSFDHPEPDHSHDNSVSRDPTSDNSSLPQEFGPESPQSARPHFDGRRDPPPFKPYLPAAPTTSCDLKNPSHITAQKPRSWTPFFAGIPGVGQSSDTRAGLSPAEAADRRLVASKKAPARPTILYVPLPVFFALFAESWTSGLSQNVVIRRRLSSQSQNVVICRKLS